MTSGSDRGGSGGTDPMAAWRQFMSTMTPGPTQSSAGFTAPTAAFVAQLEVTLASIKDRREQTQALMAQLATFDEQLAMFEASLRPVLEWSRTMARFQEVAFDPLGLTKRRDDPPSAGS